MILTEEILSKIYPQSTKQNRLKYIGYLNEFIDKYNITTPIRVRMFLAEVGHESGQLRYSEELASGEAYEGRKDLGNIEVGDGKKYKGRGLIQLTGRSNYSELSNAFGVDFINNPSLLKEPEWAVKSACWFWNRKFLNSIADTGDFKKVTKIINGGYNGLEDRLKLYELAKQYING